MHLSSQVTELHLDVQVLSAIVGTVIPLLVALVTKKFASSSAKAVANALLSAVSGALVGVADAGGVVPSLPVFVAGIATAWISSMASYEGFWKHTGLTDLIATSTARFGIGAQDKGFPNPGVVKVSACDIDRTPPDGEWEAPIAAVHEPGEEGTA